MPGEFASSRFGWDAPARISGSAVVLQEATELLPGEALHDMIPFLPTIVDGSAPTTADGHKIWQRTPSRCDLAFYQGDDVVIPLYFNDPTLANDDMALNFEWFAQVRVIHSYRSTLVNDFIVRAEFHTGTTEADEYTKVEMFLPRSENVYSGVFRWELYSIDTEDFSRFPRPDDVEPEDWPPPDQLRTWLYGECTIVPRTTTTDFLPPVTAVVDGGPQPAVMTAGGWVVGPNGRVP